METVSSNTTTFRHPRRPPTHRSIAVPAVRCFGFVFRAFGPPAKSGRTVCPVGHILKVTQQRQAPTRPAHTPTLLSEYPNTLIFKSVHIAGWLGSRVVSVLDSGAEGPGFKLQPRRCRVTVLWAYYNCDTSTIRLRFDYDSSTIQHPTRSYVLSSNNEHVNSFPLL